MKIYILNLLDLLFTLYALSLGYQEANPLMRNVSFMLAYKLAVVPLLAGILHKLNARRSMAACAVVYGALCLYHIVNLIWVVMI